VELDVKVCSSFEKEHCRDSFCSRPKSQAKRAQIEIYAEKRYRTNQEGERHQRLIREVEDYCNEAVEQITLVSASMVAPNAITVICSSALLRSPPPPSPPPPLPGRQHCSLFMLTASMPKSIPSADLDLSNEIHLDHLDHLDHLRLSSHPAGKGKGGGTGREELAHVTLFAPLLL